MTWNHRVVKKTHTTGEISYGVHEVYYNDEGKPISCTQDAVEPYGETLEELKREIERFSKATELPILDYDKIAK
jgi:hypothetical protein